MRILYLAAVNDELGDLPGDVVGVGPISAAASAARLLASDTPDAVVLVGTAGAYPGGPEIGTVIASDRVAWSYGVAAMGLGYVPRPPAAIRSDAPLAELSKVPRHDVLTTGAVTTDPTLCERLSDGFTVEHLEAYGVAHACEKAGVPFLAILGIANVVGPNAHVEWLANRESAQDAARDIARSLGV